MAETALLALGASAEFAAGASTVIGTIGTLASTGIGIISALNQSNTMQAQADLARISGQSGMITAEMELVKGQQQANQIRENLLKTLASQNARYASSGIVLDSGTPATVSDVTSDQADRETTVVTTNAGMKAATQRIVALGQMDRANLLSDQADWTLIGGVGGSLINGAIGLSKTADLIPGSKKLGDKLLA